MDSYQLTRFWGLDKQNAASDRHCLLTGISIKNKMKIKTVHQTPLKLDMLVQLIWMDKSTRQMWVNGRGGNHFGFQKSCSSVLTSLRN